jgi:phenylpyruvate tautomerase PptA (4-oxalocrotonate tautomerase family)
MVINWKVFIGSKDTNKGGIWHQGGAKDTQRARKVVTGIVERLLKYTGKVPELIEVHFREVYPRVGMLNYKKGGYDKPYDKVFSGSLEDFNEWLVNEADKDGYIVLRSGMKGPYGEEKSGKMCY